MENNRKKENIRRNKEILFGLIFTILMFILVDSYAGDISMILRVSLVSFLVLIGLFIYRLIFKR